MARGGARSGAGRPKGGISRMRLMLEEAARRGMAEAYYQANPEKRNKVDEEGAAVQAAADIVTDMMKNGRGEEVLRFAAYIGTREDGRRQERSSTLAEALARLPGYPHTPPPASKVIAITEQRKS